MINPMEGLLWRLHLEIRSDLGDIRTPSINDQIKRTDVGYQFHLSTFGDFVFMANLFRESLQYTIDNLRRDARELLGDIGRFEL
jgi:hypothetical protein